MPPHIVANDSGGKMIGNKKYEKLIEKPPRTDITFEEIESALGSRGYVLVPGSGSHYRWEYVIDGNKHMFTIVRPHGGSNTIKRGYIKRIQEILIEIEESKKG